MFEIHRHRLLSYIIRTEWRQRHQHKFDCKLGRGGGCDLFRDKGAVDAITRGLAAELGPRKIRVNPIAPGGVETEGAHSGGMMGSDFEKAMIASTPLGRIGQDIARIAVFLASNDSAWLTGERLTASRYR